jgi:hypothetical protein
VIYKDPVSKINKTKPTPTARPQSFWHSGYKLLVMLIWLVQGLTLRTAALG